MPVFGTNSSINASGYGFFGTGTGPIESSVAPRNLTEGNVITVTVTSEDIDDGTTLYYTIRGTLGTITASDFVDNSLTGTFTINSNSGSFTKAIAADGLVEEGEEFVIDIRETSHISAVIETTQSVYIQSSAGSAYVSTSGNNETYSVNVPADATTMTAKLWGAGGAGVGECPTNGFSGGSGGHVEGTVPVSGGTVDVYVGGSSSGSQPGNEGSGAGAGGGLSAIKYSGNILVAGGGGGAGQNGNGGAGGGNGGGTGGTGPSSTVNGGAGGAAATESDLSNATNRTATGGLTENPACIGGISGWYTRTGSEETDPYDLRKVVIKWDGATIGTFDDDELTSIGTIKGIAYGGYFYIPTNKVGNSAYGWCTDDSCGTCSSPNGDTCNSFNITRYTLPSGSGPGSGGAGGGGNGTSWNNGSNVKDGGAAGGSGLNQGNRGGGGGAGYFGGGGGGGGDGSGNCTGAGGGGGSGVISGSWTNTASEQGLVGTGGGRTARDSGDVDYVSGYGGSGQGGLVVITFE